MIGRFFACLLGVLLLCGMVARAQFIPLGFKGPTIAAGYTGPGDIVSGALGYWGFDAYNAAWADGTHKSATIKRASDSTSQDILILSTGLFDVASATTFCASTTCKVTTLYDQSGNGRDAIGTNGTPLSFTGCPPGIGACINETSAGATSSLTTAGAITQSQPFSYLDVVWQNPGFAGVVKPFRETSGTCYIGMSNNTGSFFVNHNCGSVITHAASGATWYAVGIVFNGASGLINFNGTTDAGNYGSTALSETMQIGDGTSQPVYHVAAGLWPAALTSTNLGDLVTNARDSSHFNF